MKYHLDKRLMFQPYEHTGQPAYVVEVVKLTQGGAELSNGFIVGDSGDVTTFVGDVYCESGYVDDCIAVI